MSELSARLDLDGQEPFQIEDSGGSQGLKFSHHMRLLAGDNEELAGEFCKTTIEEISRIVVSARRWNQVRDNWENYAQIMNLNIDDNELADYFFTCYRTRYSTLNVNQRTKIKKIIGDTFDGIMGRLCVKLYGEGTEALGHTGYVHGLGFYQGIRGALSKMAKNYRSVHLNATLSNDRTIEQMTKTFVHESTHKYAGTGDEFYIDRANGTYAGRIPRRRQATGLTFDNYITGIPVDRCLNNADSTAWFCQGMMEAILNQSALYAGANGDVRWSSKWYREGEWQQVRLQAGQLQDI